MTLVICPPADGSAEGFSCHHVEVVISGYLGKRGKPSVLPKEKTDHLSNLERLGSADNKKSCFRRALLGRAETENVDCDPLLPDKLLILDRDMITGLDPSACWDFYNIIKLNREEQVA